MPHVPRSDIADVLFIDPPGSHGAVTSDATGGSTGTPPAVRRTELFHFMFNAVNLRDLLRQRWDFDQTLALIKHVPGLESGYPKGAALEDWGGAVGSVYRTGAAVVLTSAGV